MKKSLLQSLIVDKDLSKELIRNSVNFHSWYLSKRQLCDLELLLNGAFSPLTSFMNREDYESVIESMRLSNGQLWPIPIVLDVYEKMKDLVRIGDTISLRDPEGTILAFLHVEDIWRPDRKLEAKKVYGTTNPEHRGVNYLLNSTHEWYIGGRLEGISLPVHSDFVSLRYSPAELQEMLAREYPNIPIIGFQTRNPLHRAHQMLTYQAAKELNGHILLHPAVGATMEGDIDYVTRVKCYQAILGEYPPNSVTLAILPLAMRMAGPKEAVWHAMIRKNYGCTHMIIGRDHAGASDSAKKPFYKPNESYELASAFQEEIGVQILGFSTIVYVEELDQYVPESDVPKGMSIQSISGTKLRESIKDGTAVPSWFTFPKVMEELKKRFPHKVKQGFTVFFTGLSGAGKSTLARALNAKLVEEGTRRVTLLDGDVVRHYLSAELGFSKEDRDKNIKRIGFVASEITKHGGIAICSPIAPYEETRQFVKKLIEEWGPCFIIHISTPLEKCEERDSKGLYAKARSGIIEHFTGISDPYEPPIKPDLTIDTSQVTVDEALIIIWELINDYL